MADFIKATDSLNEGRKKLNAIAKEMNDKEVASMPEVVEARGDHNSLAQAINSKITKGTGGVSSADLSQEVKEQMTGGSVAVVGRNAITKENIVNGAVTPEKLQYIPAPGVQGKNLFNKNDIIPDSIISNATGKVMPTEHSFHTSGYIPVNPETTYRKNTSHPTGFYDVEFNFIDVVTGSSNRTFTTPVDCFYIRTVFEQDNIDEIQVEVGTTSTSYEPYAFYSDPETFRDNSIPIEKLYGNYATLEVVGKNLFNKETAIEDTYPSYSTGEIRPQLNFSSSDFIPIEPGKSYAKTDWQQVAFYDKDKNYVSGIDSTRTFEAPENAHFVRLAVAEKHFNYYQLEEGTTTTPYEPYRLEVPKENLPDYLVPETNEVEILLPNELFLVTGEEFNIYFRNILTYNLESEKLAVRVTEKSGNNYVGLGKNLPYKWYYTPTESGIKNIEIRVFDVYNENRTVAQKEVKLTITEKNIQSISEPTIVTIGDSFTDGYLITKYMDDFLTEDSNNQPNFIGLHDTGKEGVKDDAWSGQSYAWYTKGASSYKRADRTDGTEDSTPNQFYNPATEKFDFSYYMDTHQNNQKVDLFLSLLGINDSLMKETAGLESRLETLLVDVADMFESVLDYDNTITILPILITPLNDVENEEFINSHGTWNTAKRSARNVEIFNKAMLEKFDTPEWKNKGVHLVAVNANFDYRYGIRQHTISPVKFDPEIKEVVSSDIHPSTIGSKYIADTMRNAIRHFQE